MNQVADLPHQGLVASDRGLRGGAIVVEAGCCHRTFDVLDRLFGLRDARFKLVDSVASRFFGASFLASLGIGPLLFVERRLRRLFRRLLLASRHLFRFVGRVFRPGTLLLWGTFLPILPFPPLPPLWP